MASSSKKPAAPDDDDDVDLLAPCTGLDALFYGLSIAVFAASAVADLFVVIEHWLNTYKSWACFTIGLAFVPSFFLQLLSLKWYQTNGKLKPYQWISHVFHLAVIQRFCFLLNHAIKMIKSPVDPQKRDLIFKLEKDAFTLNLFTSILVFIPQIIFQVYVMAVLQHISFWTSTSTITSLCSLTWSLTSYSLLANRTIQDESRYTWSSMMMQSFWRGGMLASRIAALVLAAIYLKIWIIVVFVIHTLGTILSVIHQTTKSRTPYLDELIYKCVIGAVYFFDFIKLTDNQVKYHTCLFYAVMIAENAAFYVIYLLYFKGHYHTNVFIVSSVMIVGGSFIGAISMIMHFCMFPSVKSVKLCKRMQLNSDSMIKISSNKSVRNSPGKKKWNNESTNDRITSCVTSDTSADKKLLLTNAESMEKGIVNSSFSKNDESNVTVEIVVEDKQAMNCDVSSIKKFQNQAVIDNMTNDKICYVSSEKIDQNVGTSVDSLQRQKRRGICSEIELELKPNECNIDVDHQSCSQKRRGICSLTQLGLELVTDEENYVEKSFSLDKVKSNSDVSVDVENKSLDSVIIESLPIKSLTADNCDAMMPDKILTRGRLHTPVISDSGDTNLTIALVEKERNTEKQQEEETMSHVTSIHDYENLCPLGVARPPWCIRSWRGYTDIETYVHDDSIVRDRRRDTLTSTATMSSDFSDVTYASMPFKKLMRRSRQDDYLDTLIYDLVDWETTSKPKIEEISADNAAETIQDQANLFSAKPIVIDEKGGMLALDTILEEREDAGFELSELRTLNRLNKPSSCTVSSLVATIDEIRRCAVDNSPRHIYHRTESQWEDIEQKIIMKSAHLAKVLFTNERNNYSIGYTQESLLSQPDSDKLKIMREMTGCCFKDVSGNTPLINAILSDSPVLGPKTDVQPEETDQLLEEDNVYVDMDVLGAQKCSSKEHMEADKSLANNDVQLHINSALAQSKDSGFSEKRTDCGVRKKVAFVIDNEVINDSLSDTSIDLPVIINNIPEETKVPALEANPTSFGIDRRRNIINNNRPRRKFSLLRERFEPPKVNEQIFSSTEAEKEMQIIGCSSLNTPILRDLNVKGSLNKHNFNTTKTQLETSENIREKRNIFLKQVLSPPRFQGWGKKRTFSPNAKIIPKAH